MFPFKFGVMFGDIGHGGLLFIFGGILCCMKEKIMAAKIGLEPLIQARYLILLMGFFAFYCGLIYNDFFSLPWNLFGSCWEHDHCPTEEYDDDGECLHPDHEHSRLIENCVYPFGLDPKWYIASNELNFFNSLKMKLAVIIGVL